MISPCGLAVFCLLIPAAIAGDKAMDNGQADVSMGIGGAGGVYFLASPGELVIDLHKRDLNRGGVHTELRAVLAGPDRRVIRDVSIPDDGRPAGSGPGPWQRVRMTADVKRAGIYALNITISQDRYGEGIVWGFETNCPRYLIETSRGHKDERHQEPIVFFNPGVPGDICFMPRNTDLAVDVTGLPKNSGPLEIFDANGKTLAVMQIGTDGKASCRFDPSVPRDAAPWRLHLPSQEAVVNIDGVTRWDDKDPHPNLGFWTNKPSSFFPLQSHRWLLTPYSRTVYGVPGQAREIEFLVQNNSASSQDISLSLEFPDEEWDAKIGAGEIALKPGESRKVPIRFTIPKTGDGHDAGRICHIRATPKSAPDFSTYSSLIVRTGEAPASRPLALPLDLKPYSHENEQLGYLPDYPLENQFYFDSRNRPYSLTASGIAFLRDSRWVRREFRDAVKGALAGGDFSPISTKIAFDADNDIYVLARSDGRPALLRSADGGETFSACLIEQEEGKPAAFDIEQFSGHDIPSGPPPVARFTRTGRDPKLIWRTIHDLDLFLPEKTPDGVRMGAPARISSKCIGLAAHSGIPSSLVSRGDKVHVIWAEATEPDEKVPGVPTYVVTYDRATKSLDQPALIGYGPPANDVHNTPSITMDSGGTLHALVGTHGRTFKYARSLKPNDASSGWTEAEDVGPGLRQTYVGLLCDNEDALHLVFRLWHTEDARFPHSTYPTLSHMRKRPGGAWEAPRALVAPPFSEYSVFYHRLTVDRRGRLFLSYDYWSTYWFYRNDNFGTRRALMMTDDSGVTWRLAATADFK